jgi:xylan 1,4-beta-xylosidase
MDLKSCGTMVFRPFLFLVFAISIFVDAANAAEPSSTTSTRTYRNPLLEKWDMADPHVLAVDGKYYLYPTSHTKGYDALVSDDLVNWNYKGSVFTSSRGGAWAPDVFHNKRGDGKFYLYFTDNMPNAASWSLDKQIGTAVADSPLGPFNEKNVLATNCIDAHLYQDDDGKYYLYYVEIINGFKILAQEMANPLTKKGNPKEVIRPTEDWERVSGHVTEGPWMLKRNGIYYLMFSGTGADSPNYGIGYATSKSPTGPFEKHKGNPIVKRNDVIFGPGHHSVVEGPDKKLWMIYHQKRTDSTGFHRYLALDPIWFDDAGVIHSRISKNSSQPAPLFLKN